MIAPRPELLHTPPAEHGGRSSLSGDPYIATEQEVRHDFSACINAFGPADVVRRAVATAPLHEYPDPYSRAARSAAVKRWECDPEGVTFGAGAAELIYAVASAYLRRHDHVLIAEPAFGEYARAALIHGARSTTVRAPDFPATPSTSLASEIRRVRPRLAFIAAPASPTGEALPLSAILEVAEQCRLADTLLVLDQAYDAFSGEQLGTPALPAHPNVLHLRSLTKDHALAGVRAAFAIAPSGVIRTMDRVRAPWTAPAAAQAAAVAALTEEAESHVRRTTAVLRTEAARIAGTCAAHGLRTMESSTHYLVIRCGHGKSARDRLLAERGILVRDCASFGLPEWIRVAARTPAENDALIAALPGIAAHHAHRGNPHPATTGFTDVSEEE